MHPELLDYYARELRHVREGAGEFAREFPQVAGRLGLSGMAGTDRAAGSECPDPYVERLLEGFAYLTARVQLKQDAEFPRFSQHLLESVYPHYLPPTPSMTIVQLQPNPQEGALAAGYTVPRHSVLRARLGPRQQTACRFRTAHEVTLFPLEVARAEYRAFVGDLAGIRLPAVARARASIRLRLRVTAGMGFDQLALDRLPIYLGGDPRTATRLYELLVARRVGVIVRPGDDPTRWQVSVPGTGADDDEGLAQIGFSDDEALLPFGPRSFQGYRLLHEYFAFPQRCLFLELRNLKEIVRRHAGEELEILFLLDRGDEALEGAVHAGHFALHCTPAINLFPKRTDRIALDERSHEYQVIPDRTRPLDYEVHSITEVVGLGSDDLRQDFQPLHGAHRRKGQGGDAFYTLRREPRQLSTRQQQRGTRASYVGSETFLALVDGTEGPFRSGLKQLSVETLCTNRDLPLLLPVGQGETDFTLESGGPVAAIRCLAGPTPPRASPAHKDVTWRLISHLSLNYLSLTEGDGQGQGQVDDTQGAGALRELLRLYADFGEATNRGQVEAVRTIHSQPVVRRFPGPGPAGFGRGLQIHLTCDESSSEGLGAFLLGAVLERFFARYVSINSFTETVLKSVQRGEIMRWAPRPGRRRTL
jgi:type VI secretion system protein ImpG